MFWLVLSWVGFCDTDRVKGEDNQLCIFCFVPYNKLLTSLACSSSAGKYWPSAIIVRTLLQLFCIATTLGQYSPVWRLCSVSKRFILKKICIFLWCYQCDFVYFVLVSDFSSAVNGELPQSVLKNLRWVMQKVSERTHDWYSLFLV